MHFQSVIRAVVSLLLVVSASLGAQVDRAPLVIGERLTLQSDVLSEQRQLLVSVPSGYATSDTMYPLLLLLDAETHFIHTVGLTAFLSHRWVGQVPPMVVAGIVNTDRLRDVTPTATERFPDAGGVSRFLDFIETEVLPLLSREYRIDDRPILVGHSGSGLAVLFAFQRFGEAFRGYIAVDPSLDWDTSITVRELNEFLEQQSALSTYLTFGSYKPKADTGELVSVLERHNVPGLRWSAPIYAGETHNSMVHDAFAAGLKSAFKAPGS